MFELEAEIRDWRARLTEDLRDEDLDELEGHLTEEIALLRAKGLSAEEGFVIAARRLGGERELCGEFAKVYPGAAALRQFQWMIVGFLGISVLLSAFRSLSLLVAGTAMWNGWDGNLSAVLLRLVQVAGLGGLVLVRVSRMTLPSGRRFWTLGVLLALTHGIMRLAGDLIFTRILGGHGYGLVWNTVLPGLYISWAAAILVPWILIRRQHDRSQPGHTV